MFVSFLKVSTNQSKKLSKSQIKLLLQKAKEDGFESIEDYVRGNLHYLPKWKQDIFHLLEQIKD